MVIQLDAVSRWSGPGVAVRSVSFRARPGEVTALVGPNGSGTSTVLALAAGVLRPDAGRVTSEGSRGVLLDGRVRPTAGTVRDVVGARADRLGLRPCRVEDVLDAVGLAAAGDRPVVDLGPGAHQLLGLAQALLPDPAVLLLDQPVTGLDRPAAERVLLLLRRTAADGRTVLVSAHDPSTVVPPADRLVVLRDGTVVDDVAADDPAHPPPARVRTPDPQRLAALFECADLDADGVVVVHGHTTETIARLASAYCVPVYELTPVRSLA